MPDLTKYNYTGETPKPVFNTNFYSGEDLSSDGDIEDKIISLIAQKPIMKKLSAIISHGLYSITLHAYVRIFLTGIL